MKFASVTFTAAGIWGFGVLLPLYFMFDTVGREYPPPITHPDLYYGFIGLAIAWQIAFLIIGRNPTRFHPLMIAAIVEKFIFVISQSVLYAQGRVELGQLAVAAPDCILGILFVLAYRSVGRSRPADE